ncbi:MAG TPA: hypothetical protein VFT74_14890, partial [Isosphaeraceae bacterium]|nr:hypothetical protein [Isosphaeraceae bacterium]
RRFNEHYAPLFETVTWATWTLTGPRLVATPGAFVTASLLPFLLCSWVLGTLVRQETGSLSAGLLAACGFALSTAHLETAWWYSASSFAWALLATLLAWKAADRALRARTRPALGGGLLLVGLLALFGPAFCAIGLLAGPLSAVKAVFETGQRLRRRLLVVLASALGVFAYLGVLFHLHFHEVWSHSVRQNSDLASSLLTALRAPVEVLLPTLVGMGDRVGAMPAWIAPVLFLAGSGVSWRFAAGRPGWRLVPAGLVLILGGYALTYTVRYTESSDQLMHVQRYHLFPQAGLVILLSVVFLRVFCWLDRHPRMGRPAIFALAAVLLIVHWPTYQDMSRFYGFPEQARTLRALDHLEAVCRTHEISREQALVALDPIHPRWFEFPGFNALMLLGPTVDRAGCDNDLARSTILASLPQDEIEALYGGMDASAYLRPRERSVSASDSLRGVVSRTRNFRELAPGIWQSVQGVPSSVEFRLERREPTPSGLGLNDLTPGGKLEIWWAEDDGSSWSETRRLLLSTDSTQACRDWVLPLDRIPHWDVRHVNRLLVRVRSQRTITLGTPTLIR